MSDFSVSPRIAILGTRGIPASYGGFETFAEELSTRLVENGVEVTVYCEDPGGSPATSYKGVDLRYIPSTPFGPLTSVLFDVRCLWDARRAFSVVYLLGYGAAQFCFIPRLFGRQVWLNGIEWMRAKWGRLARIYLKAMEFFSTLFPSRVIADAEGIRQHLVARHRRMPPCTVIPYGAPVIETAPEVGLLGEWDLRPWRYYLVVCRMEPENHVREIVEGFIASDSLYPLIIVGDHRADTDFARGLICLASDRIRFIGTVFEKPKLQSLRYHCSAYFHGHSVGGTNPSLLEAMGCGNVVLAHDNLFNREVLLEDGRFFENAEAISNLIQEIEVMSAQDRKDLSDCVKLRIRTAYSWDLIADSYLRLLDEVLDIGLPENS